jgi:hypothetical protein
MYQAACWRAANCVPARHLLRRQLAGRRLSQRWTYIRLIIEQLVNSQIFKSFVPLHIMHNFLSACFARVCSSLALRVFYCLQATPITRRSLMRRSRLAIRLCRKHELAAHYRQLKWTNIWRLRYIYTAVVPRSLEPRAVNAGFRAQSSVALPWRR